MYHNTYRNRFGSCCRSPFLLLWELNVLKSRFQSLDWRKTVNLNGFGCRKLIYKWLWYQRIYMDSGRNLMCIYFGSLRGAKKFYRKHSSQLPYIKIFWQTINTIRFMFVHYAYNCIHIQAYTYLQWIGWGFPLANVLRLRKKKKTLVFPVVGAGGRNSAFHSGGPTGN